MNMTSGETATLLFFAFVYLALIIAVPTVLVIVLVKAYRNRKAKNGKTTD